MPNAKNRAGNSGHRERRKGGGSEACRKAGVLHSNFDGKSLCLGHVKAQKLSKAKAASVAQKVVQDYDGKDNRACRENFLRVARDDRSDNQGDRDDGNRGQYRSDFLRELSEELVDDKAQANRNDDDLYDRKEHRDDVNMDAFLEQQVSDGGSEERSEQSVYACHSDRKSDVALGKISDYVAGGSAGTSSDKNDAGQKPNLKAKDFSQGKGQKRHDGELGKAADDDVLWAGKDKREVFDFERESHSEHDQHQKRVDPRRLDPKTTLRNKERQSGHGQNNQGHELSKEVSDFF